jgi:hypothetical protein
LALCEPSVTGQQEHVHRFKSETEAKIGSPENRRLGSENEANDIRRWRLFWTSRPDGVSWLWKRIRRRRFEDRTASYHYPASLTASGVNASRAQCA